MIPASGCVVGTKSPAKGSESRPKPEPRTGSRIVMMDAPTGGSVPVPAACHLIHFLLEGRVSLRVTGGGIDRSVSVGPGSVTVLPAGAAYTFRADGPNRAVVCAIATADLHAIGPVPAVGVLPRLGVTDPALWFFGEALARELAEPEQIGSGDLVGALHLGLTIQLLRGYAAGARRADPEAVRATRMTSARLAKAQAFIAAHLADDFALSDLAAAVGVSPFHFARMFKGAVSLTPHQYLTRARIERAKQLLHQEGLSLVRIALDVGFSSQSHLTAVFHKVVGLTPAVYRERCGTRAPADRSGPV